MAILERLKEMQNATGKNRLIMVLDGMGVTVMNKLLNKNGFFASHLTDTETAIIPATTVAATTAYLTGKMPWETGFVGWAQYFPEINEVVEVFTNKNFYTRQDSKLPQHSSTLPCKTVVEQMNEHGKQAFAVVPWFMGGADNFDDWLKEVVETCNRETNAYIYSYWPEPDSTLHIVGSKDEKAKKILCEMERKIENAFKKINNKTDVLITADHGHTDTDNLFVEDFPEIANCLSVPTSLEARCVSFFVKPEYKQRFPEIFNKHLGNDFKLVTKDEFEKEYLHAGKPVRFIGDYVALATGKYNLWENHNCETCKSHHAGITKDELEIPIIKMSLQNYMIKNDKINRIAYLYNYQYIS